MAQVGAHDDERLRTTPDQIEEGRRLTLWHLTDCNRQHEHVAERHLQERKLHLDAVFRSVRLVRHDRDAIGNQDARELGVDPSEAEWCLEGVCAGHGRSR